MSVPYVTIGELGDLVQVQTWRIARLFELGIVEEPARVGGRRLIPKSLIPRIVCALQDRGWVAKTSEKLPGVEEESQREASTSHQTDAR